MRISVKSSRAFGASLVLAVLLGATAPTTNAASPHTVTVMTQNLYQGTELANTIAATNQQQFLLGVATDYTNVVNTNFPERADAIAGEIAQARPNLVGLQEMALWQTFPVDARGNPSGPPTVTYDFEKILLERLAAHGVSYTTAVKHVDFSVAGVGLFSAGLLGVSLTEQLAILVRSDQPVTDAQQAGYKAAITLQTFRGPVTIGSSWASVDTAAGGRPFRFITTHLSSIGPQLLGVQPQQMQELLAGPAMTSLPVVIAADFNTTPTMAAPSAYTEALGAGFADEWLQRNHDDPGYTAFQVLPTIDNATSNLSERIDYVLGLGPIAPHDVDLVGATPSARTPSGLWPADHAGVVASLKIKKDTAEDDD
jgi:endonuclease/exonuclease/phosphatase family metal-dependent hydrolase